MRRQIYTYHVNQQDEIQQHRIKLGPYQPLFKKFKKSEKGQNFQGSWYEDDCFKSWLEYSPKYDAAFCLPCFLFHKSTGHDRQMHSQLTDLRDKLEMVKAVLLVFIWERS